MMRFFTCLAALALMTLSGNAQDAKSQIRIKKAKIAMEQQQTPQIQASNIVDKRWKPKTWIEFDTEFEIDLPRTAGGEEGSFPALEFKYYAGVNAQSKERKTIVLTGTITYQNIPAHGDLHALAFISPSTLKRVLLKDNGGKADVGAFGVEIRVNGEVLTFASSNGRAWWIDAATKQPSDSFSFEDGGVLGKDKTPFAPFWGDYDVTPQSR